MSNHAGARAIIDGENVRLHIYDRQIDEFVVLTPIAARTLGFELVAIADRLAVRAWEQQQKQH